MKKSDLLKEQGTEIAPEYIFRKNMLDVARSLKCENELKQIFDKFDKLLRNCTNDTERSHISALGVQEVNQLFRWHEDMFFNGPPEFVKKDA